MYFTNPGSVLACACLGIMSKAVLWSAPKRIFEGEYGVTSFFVRMRSWCDSGGSLGRAGINVGSVASVLNKAFSKDLLTPSVGCVKPLRTGNSQLANKYNCVSPAHERSICAARNGFSWFSGDISGECSQVCRLVGLASARNARADFGLGCLRWNCRRRYSGIG